MRPPTIPALKEWVPGGGEFSLRPGARIVVDPGVDGLLSEANLLADELDLRVVDVSALREGDIYLRLDDTGQALGREGYEFSVNSRVDIRAPTRAGIFYGTRTLLQLLRRGSRIPTGRARDWPRYPERGLMVANGESYVAAFFERQIKELAYLKLNYLHLHFGDYRWQIESGRHPEIASDERVCLTKDEVRRIVALADRHHITVVPEIDMPGHMIAALAPHPELRLEDASGALAEDKLDITNPAAFRFVRALIEEYLPLFPGPYWHAGADEYVVKREASRFPKLDAFAVARYGPQATVWDALAGFVNAVDELVRRHGKTLRIWSDQVGRGRRVSVNPGVVVERWTDGLTPQELVDARHQVMNCGWFPTYVANLDARPGRVPVDIRRAYESWEVNQFYAGEDHPPPVAEPHSVAQDEPRNLGSKVNLWWGERPSLVSPVIYPRLQVIAQKTWGSAPPAPDYDEFQRLGAEIGTGLG